MHIGFHVNKHEYNKYHGENTSDDSGDTEAYNDIHIMATPVSVEHKMQRDASASIMTLASACSTAIKDIRKYADNVCIQVFITGPRNGKPDSELEEMKNISTSARVYVHGSYINSPWKERTHVLRNELRLANNIMAHGVVVHLGRDAKLSKLDKVFAGLELTMVKPYIWLEINSAKPSEHTFETVDKLTDLFVDINDDRIGLCIDTAHLYACGVNLGSYEAAESWLRDIQWALPNVRKLIHLNDSSAELGSGRDVHENLFHGNIWSAYKKRRAQSGVAAIIEWCQLHKYDIIVERSRRNSMQDIRVVAELI